MGGFSLWHILIFAVIVLLLFGGNRFSNMMGDVAKGLKSFKKGMAEDDDVPPARPRERIEQRAADAAYDADPVRREPLRAEPPRDADRPRDVR